MGSVINEKELVPIKIEPDMFEDQLVLRDTDLETGDEYEYVVQYYPFRLVQKVNAQVALIVNEHDTLFFENSLEFLKPRVNITDADVMADIFYKSIISKLTEDDLNNHYGWLFLKSEKWLENYISWLQYEKYMMKSRESYMVGVYMTQVH